MNAKDARNGIDICLSNGKRLYDDAETLYKNKRYHTSIPLYILAYEEFCKAEFLGSRFVTGKELQDEEFRRLTHAKDAHTTKILIDALAFRKMLENETDQQIANRKNFALKIGMPFTKLSRQDAIDLNKKFEKMFAKLNDLKMAMLYVDYAEGSWLKPKRFDDSKLREVCEYLRHEVIRVFHEVRVNLFYHANGITGDSTKLSEEQVSKIQANEDFRIRLRLDQKYRTPVFARCLSTVLAITDSL